VPPKLIGFLGSIWWLGVISVNWSFLLDWGFKFIRTVDQGWFEKFGPQGISDSLGSGSLIVDFARF